MTTLINVLQSALILYIFLVPLFTAKGKLRLTLIGAGFGLSLVLLVLYMLLPLDYSVSILFVLILTIAYLCTLIYIISKYQVRTEPVRASRRSSRSKDDRDVYSDDYDIDDNFDTEPSAGFGSSGFNKAPLVRGSGREVPLPDLAGASGYERQSSKTGLDSKFDFNTPSRPSEVVYDLGAGGERPADKYKTAPISTNSSKEDDISSDFLFDFGGGDKKAGDSFSSLDFAEKSLEIPSGDSSKSDLGASFGKFMAEQSGEDQPFSFGSSFDALKDIDIGNTAFDNIGNVDLPQAEPTLDELLGDFSFLKGTLAKVDSKFMTSDMDLEYVLLENINAQNIRAKIIDKNTIYINKFASEIALANAQRLLIEANLTDAKRLLAQLCCSSTDSAISNEAYICFKEIVFGKDSDQENDELINAMIDKEEKLVELVKKITKG